MNKLFFKLTRTKRAPRINQLVFADVDFRTTSTRLFAGIVLCVLLTSTLGAESTSQWFGGFYLRLTSYWLTGDLIAFENKLASKRQLMESSTASIRELAETGDLSSASTRATRETLFRQLEQYKSSFALITDTQGRILAGSSRALQPDDRLVDIGPRFDPDSVQEPRWVPAEQSLPKYKLRYTRVPVLVGSPLGDWPIVRDALEQAREPKFEYFSGTEQVTVENLTRLGLWGQANLLAETDAAGTALMIMAVRPIRTDGRFRGLAVSGYLINRDPTLVDGIALETGKATATLYAGDIRVSTNQHPSGSSKRLLGARAPRELIDSTLRAGQTYWGKLMISNSSHYFMANPIWDHRLQFSPDSYAILPNVQPVGMLELGLNEEDVEGVTWQQVRQVSYTIAAFAFGTFLIFISYPYLKLRRTEREREQAQRALRESEQRYRGIVEDQTELICRFVPEGYLTFVNEAYCQYFGQQREELLGQEFVPFTSGDEQVQTDTRSDVYTQYAPVMTMSGEFVMPDREVRWVQWTVRSIFNEQEHLVELQAVGRDVTERKQAEEQRLALERARQLELQMVELQKLNRLKDEFLSTVSHELRTPIANMRLAIRLLEGNPTQQQQQRYLNILSQESARESDLINDLLDLQRLELGTVPTISEVLVLEEWLPHTLEPFYSRAQQRRLTLNLTLSPGLPSLSTAPGSLARVVAELVNNACKYTPAEGTIHVQVRLGCMADRPCIQLSVCNSGVEIQLEEQERIFEKFYRIANMDPWQQGGTGLGLALVKKLVEQLGGTIGVESDSGETIFTVKIPLDV
ncbi:MAG: PAS domain S-box protein [Gemmatimonadaceae bacterium]|nr:PAS domain S-box protein [Gloeobacterales cyanobacterium ES-bin-141]